MLFSDLNSVWEFLWISENKTIEVVRLREPKNAFDFIAGVLSGGSQNSVPFLAEPVNRKRMNGMVPKVVDSGLFELYENLELPKNPDDIEDLISIQRQQRDLRQRMFSDFFLQSALL
jgi:hypothetical protein